MGRRLAVIFSAAERSISIGSWGPCWPAVCRDLWFSSDFTSLSAGNGGWCRGALLGRAGMDLRGNSVGRGGCRAGRIGIRERLAKLHRRTALQLFFPALERSVSLGGRGGIGRSRSPRFLIFVGPSVSVRENGLAVLTRVPLELFTMSPQLAPNARSCACEGDRIAFSAPSRRVREARRLKTQPTCQRAHQAVSAGSPRLRRPRTRSRPRRVKS